MAQPATEKAPLDRSDDEELQLGTRARDERSRYFHGSYVMESPQSGSYGSQDNVDWSSDKKAILSQRETLAAREWGGMIDGTGLGLGMRMHRGVEVQEALDATALPMNPMSIQPNSDGIEVVIPLPPPPLPRVQRICGLRRRIFFIMYGLILAIIAIASIIGGVIAGTRSNSSALSTSSVMDPALPGSNSSINANLSPTDIMVGSPLVAFSYSNSSIGTTAADHDLLRLYYQSADGNVSLVYYNGASAGWGQASVIFTDAINNTGLALYTYLNNTQQQASIFYISSFSGTLFEKRSTPDNNYEQSNVTLDTLNLIPNPSSKPGGEASKNSWDTYRMAAVYSENFASGAGGRLFYHASNASLNYVQEVVWNFNDNKWTLGTQLSDPYPSSHLAATVDEVSHTLRLFYSAGNLTLQESFLDISDPDPNAPYQQGISFPNFLSADDSDLSAVSANGTTFLYFYDTENPSLRELTLPASLQPTPASTMNKNLTRLVAQPALTTNSTLLSFYQPLTAVVSTIGGELYINVWFAQDKVSPESGYQTLTTANRSLGTEWPSTVYAYGENQFNISLAEPTPTPYSKRKT
ncbi:MAG: hypothetical protein MMC33_004726 [Icmadophila ericetorum]|nr:hypothetical protein [Icmadophila ericetorum]